MLWYEAVVFSCDEDGFVLEGKIRDTIFGGKVDGFVDVSTGEICFGALVSEL